MNVLILSFYFPPDIGPGPLRANSLVDSLLGAGVSNLKIDVVTTMPNRYKTLGFQAPRIERLDNVAIERFELPSHESGMFDQAKAFLSYSVAVEKAVNGKQYDLVVATSSRLMTAALGARVARKTRARLYLDVRDLFTDTMEDVLAGSVLRYLMPAFKVLERRTFKSADRMNVVSSGFISYLRDIGIERPISEFTNGIDEEFVDFDFAGETGNEVPSILYAGNVGESQGLHRVLPPVAGRTGKTAKFVVLGDGGRRKLLEEELSRNNVTNVTIHNPVPRSQLFSHYKDADVLFLHLNDFKAFRRVLPSKLFEYAATGKPMLAGVSGHAADFLREHVPGVSVFAPCDEDGMIAGITTLLSGPRMIDRSEFCSRFLRKNIMREMAQDILKTVA